MRYAIRSSRVAARDAAARNQSRDTCLALLRDAEAQSNFVVESARNAWFLGRWLIFAFVLESLMVAYVPSELITRWLGGDSLSSVLIAVGIGIPAYLNGYAAIPLVAGLIDLGMNPAVGLGFMLGGGVTSVPAAMAVWRSRSRVCSASTSRWRALDRFSPLTPSWPISPSADASRGARARAPHASRAGTTPR